MTGLLERAQRAYSDARHADDVGHFADALDRYRQVAALLDREDADADDDGVAALRVRALLGVARCLYETTTDLDAAMGMVGRAEQVVDAASLESERTAVHGQRGLLWARSGDYRAALAELDLVTPGDDDEPTHDAAVVLLNRSALHLDVGDVAAATQDLRTAIRFAAAVGSTAIEAMATHNLGYLHFLLGDLPRALRSMDAAAALGDTPEPIGLLDRARVLLDAGLVTDALADLDQAAGLLEGGSVLARAEVELTRAGCLVDLRQYDRAVAAAQAAAAAFTSAGNAPWAARARTVELEALLADDRDVATRSAPPILRERAAQAAEHAVRDDVGGVFGRMLVTYPSLLAAAEWSALAGDLDAAREQVARVPAELGTAPLSLRLNRAAVLARIAFAEGRRAVAVRAVRRGQTMLAEHSGLGSVEAVAARGLRALQLNLVDTEAALDTGDPAALFDALERGRATAAGTARLVPPDDDVLADLLERARAEHQSALALGTSVEPDALRRKRAHLVRARRLQAQARQRSWQIEGDRRPVEPTVARALRAALRGLPADRGAAVVVSYAVLGGRTIAVRVDARGQTLHELAPRREVTELARRARADLAVVANALIPAPLRQAATGALVRTLDRLDALLLAPLAVDGDLHVVARGQLLTLPWTALPSRAGRRTWVGDRVDLRPGLVEAGATRPGGVVVVAGPGTDGGTSEAAAVAAVWPRARLLTGAGATTAAATAALRDAAVVHLAAHGVHAADNALFSMLRLADGPLFAHELDGVDLTGAVVVLSACELGQSTSDVGGEALGFASVLLRHGARAVIAAVAPLRDDVAVRVMPRLHGGLRDGLPPGAALAAATAGETTPVPLVCFGPLAV
ncbi:Tetratricopeptide TPR_4 [Xylanimonas cellulosilytica DSM 15894]|uniref:Tetratricopeptide TPR_4 n=1 Tax=Xylanimonas cellulosilytica (strain DSM 15894 / JCM 12276 / CECT 5975 / KCTC 9989 / LMG 20990 / NBRC 107835 / XIL07) TaxID=446471 RepID=D1BWS4_XYLCX|nr:CHAT domain-containing protein [Xylanimonas cellulosilytica]ACZ29656.1 Tetratricopeptide TPR_4 [Xylanimonas cellulosilytica DSM 15894]